MIELLAPLIQLRMRYKVLYGGRGSGKSYGIGTALLVLGMQCKLLILCAREIQVSIDASSYKLLTELIESLNLTSFYTYNKTTITGINGTQFIFRGLSDVTAESIKSLQGVNICWVEEAQAISPNSFKILLPTIREAGSEIWFSFNPTNETDPVYQYFIVNKHPRAWVQMINIEDNPFASQELLDDWEHDLNTNPEEAKHIWGGECRPAVVGAIYESQLLSLRARNGVLKIPHDPIAHTVVSWDLGIGDHTSLIVGQLIGFERRIIDCYEADGYGFSHYVNWLKNLNIRFDEFALPHDSIHKSLAADGQSMYSVLTNAFPGVKMTVVGKDADDVTLSLEEQISAVRDSFNSVFIDDNCTLLLEALRNYRRYFDKTTKRYTHPLHDKFSDMADSFRYFMLVVPPRRLKSKPQKPIVVKTLY